MPETFSTTNASLPDTKPHASQPAFPSAGAESAMNQQIPPKGQTSFFMKPYLVGAVLAALVLFLGYQQMQISQLSSELGQVSDNMKTSDVRTRLESQEASLGELNTRLAYLDSKINATDQKATAALSRIKAHEDGDVIGNMVKGLKQTLGIK